MKSSVQKILLSIFSNCRTDFSSSAVHSNITGSSIGKKVSYLSPKTFFIRELGPIGKKVIGGLVPFETKKKKKIIGDFGPLKKKNG